MQGRGQTGVRVCAHREKGNESDWDAIVCVCGWKEVLSQNVLQQVSSQALGVDQKSSVKRALCSYSVPIMGFSERMKLQPAGTWSYSQQTRFKGLRSSAKCNRSKTQHLALTHQLGISVTASMLMLHSIQSASWNLHLPIWEKCNRTSLVNSNSMSCTCLMINSRVVRCCSLCFSACQAIEHV